MHICVKIVRLPQLDLNIPKGLFETKEYKIEETKKNTGIERRHCKQTEERKNTGKMKIEVFGT